MPAHMQQGDGTGGYDYPDATGEPDQYNDTSGYDQEDGMKVGGQQAHNYGTGNYGNTYMGRDVYDQYPDQFDDGMGAFRAERRACRRKRVQGPLNSLEHFESR
jgi:hypothetical protein